MIVGYSKRFNKNFQKRVTHDSKLVSRFLGRLELLITDPEEKGLDFHRAPYLFYEHLQCADEPVGSNAT